MSDTPRSPQKGETQMVRRLSRPCYDKFHRCPGWAGGGTKFAKHQRCNSGRIGVDYERRHWKWRFHRCGTCGVTVLPYVTRWLDPRWLRWECQRLWRARW